MGRCLSDAGRVYAQTKLAFGPRAKAQTLRRALVTIPTPRGKRSHSALGRGSNAPRDWDRTGRTRRAGYGYPDCAACPPPAESPGPDRTGTTAAERLEDRGPRAGCLPADSDRRAPA